MSAGTLRVEGKWRVKDRGERVEGGGCWMMIKIKVKVKVKVEVKVKVKVKGKGNG